MRFCGFARRFVTTFSSSLDPETSSGGGQAPGAGGFVVSGGQRAGRRPRHSRRAGRPVGVERPRGGAAPPGNFHASILLCKVTQRCRSRRLTEPLRQLALRYRRPPPIPGYYRGRAERRARRCGAGSGFYSASGTIS
eukprot:COSAG06_NODE_33645_length_486_cov_2.005168_1_plen_136_part_01